MKTTKGKFFVNGFHFLSLDIRRMLSTTIKVDDELTLIPDPTNIHDRTAIKVIYNEVQIGWYEAQGYRQKEMFDYLMSGGIPKAYVTETYFRGVAKGEIVAKFEYEK